MGTYEQGEVVKGNGKGMGTRGGDKIYTKLTEMFGMDIRSLALFRIGLAIATIGDLIERSLDLRAHYSDEGIFPRYVLFEQYANNYTFFIHAMCGHTNFQAFVFLLHGLCALCMLVGWRSRLFTFLTWIMLVSLQSRNPFLNHGGDLYFRLIFFYAIFLPLGGCFSVDSALSNVQHKPQRNPRVLTGGTFALIAQIAIMYIVSTYHKTGNEWTQEYTSTWYAIQLDYYKTDVARFLDPYHETLRLLTFLVLHWEFLGNFCFAFPIYTDYFRLLAVLGFFGMHLGFILCIRLGFFFWVCTVAMFPLIPTLVWDTIAKTRVMRAAAQRSQTITVRYDEHSKFSWSVARLMCTFMCIPFTQLSFLTTKYELLEVSEPDSWLEVEAGSKTAKNLQAIHLAFENSIMYPPTRPVRAVCGLLARFLRAPIAFARRRLEQLAQKYHSTSQYHPPPPQAHKKKRFRLGDIFILGCVMYAISWNGSNLGTSVHLPYSTNWVGLVLHLDQFWGMFSPHPPKAHWYYVIQATQDDGTEFELFKNEGIFKWEGNQPFNFDKPKPFHLSFKNHRWYKFFEMGFNGDGHEAIRLNFGRWVCREYNARHHGKERLYNYKVWFLLEWQQLYGDRSTPSKQVLWEHVCYHKQ